MNYVNRAQNTHPPIYSNWPCSGSRVTHTSNFYKWLWVMMSNLCTPWGPSPQKIRGGFFPTPLGLGAWSKLFLAIVPEKEYPKLILKFWGLPLKIFSVVCIASWQGTGEGRLSPMTPRPFNIWANDDMRPY